MSPREDDNYSWVCLHDHCLGLDYMSSREDYDGLEQSIQMPLSNPNHSVANKFLPFTT